MTPEEFNEVCQEYDNAPDDFAFNYGHPVFQLAQENDQLKAELSDINEGRSVVAPQSVDHAQAMILVAGQYLKDNR